MITYGPPPDRVTKLTMVAVFEKVKKYEEAGVFRNELGMSKVILREIDDNIQLLENRKKTERIKSTEAIMKKTEINVESKQETILKENNFY